MKTISPERIEYLKILILTVFRKVKLFYGGFGFLFYVLLLFKGIPQVRFFYLTLFPLLSPWLLEQILIPLKLHKKKETAPVYFPMLQKNLRYTQAAFYAHIISMLLYYILMTYLIVSMHLMITWYFLIICVLVTILILLRTIRRIQRLAFFRP